MVRVDKDTLMRTSVLTKRHGQLCFLPDIALGNVRGKVLFKKKKVLSFYLAQLQLEAPRKNLYNTNIQ
jgi:hypothetical protein